MSTDDGTIEIGQAAPDFTLKNQYGEDVTLARIRSAHAAPRTVVVMFYPFAFSGVCTGELRDVRDQLPRFTQAGAEVLAISCDPIFALRAFAERDELTFSLLSDFWPHGELASAYGVLDAERGCALRGTYVVDRDGAVRWKVENELPDARDLETVIGALDDVPA